MTEDCAICFQPYMHPCKLPCGHIFCFLCMKGLKNRTCALCRTEFNSEFIQTPHLISVNNVTETTNSYKWFYEGKDGNFFLLHL